MLLSLLSIYLTCETLILQFSFFFFSFFFSRHSISLTSGHGNGICELLCVLGLDANHKTKYGYLMRGFILFEMWFSKDAQGSNFRFEVETFRMSFFLANCWIKCLELSLLTLSIFNCGVVHLCIGIMVFCCFCFLEAYGRIIRCNYSLFITKFGDVVEMVGLR